MSPNGEKEEPPEREHSSKAVHMRRRHDYVLAMHALEVHTTQEKRLAIIQHELYDFTKRLKEALRSLGSENVDQFTLTAVRAGHATELARLRVDLAQSMGEGEWSSRAIFCDINMEQVDQSVLLRKLVEHDGGFRVASKAQGGRPHDCQLRC